MLIVMSGLPAAGKSAVADDLGQLLPAAVLSVDPVEVALWKAGIDHGQPTGLAAYIVVEALAGQLLTLGQTVIIDAVNDAREAREQWRGLARRHGVELRFIEVFCSDPAAHRRRLEGRRRELAGFVEPTWDAVDRRRPAFADWDEPRLILDSVRTHASNVQTAVGHLARKF
jgi:predicted kinase